MACRRALLFLLAMPAIIGCSEGVDLTVAGRADAIELAAASADPDFHVCIDQAAIFSAGADAAHPAWEAGRTGPRICLGRLRMGPSTAAVAQRVSAPIVAGRHYCAEVRGPGFAERRGFTLRDGAVAADAGGGC